MNSTILTVAIPTYNRLEYLKTCIKSVEASCALVEDRIEIFVSDNKSEDGTKQFLESYVPTLQNITFKWKQNFENIGGTSNIRSMLNGCSGKYIYWVTDDDIVLPVALTKIIGEIKKSAPSYIRVGMIVNLIKSKRAFYWGLKEYGQILIESKSFLKLIQLSNVLTGTVHINEANAISQISKSKNIYICTDMLLYNTKKILYLDEVCNIHTWENPIFWEKEINYLKDVGATRKKKQRKLNLDFQGCIYDSPIYKLLNKTDLVLFLTSQYGLICDDIAHDLKGGYALKFYIIKGLFEYHIKNIFKNIIQKLKK
jgi:glycosyltransferase involved in cell wall biosynthesis